MVVSLFLVCLIAAGLLSKVYTTTQLLIQKRQQENTINRLSDLLPGAKTFQEVVKDSAWLGLDERNQKIGIVFKVAPQGYNGTIPMMIGYGIDQNVKKIYIPPPSEGLKETPGLGQQVQEEKFKDQFSNKTYPELKLIKDGGSIQAITAATISSRAIVNGVRMGIEQYKHYIEPDSIEPIRPDICTDENMLTRLSKLLPEASQFRCVIEDTVWIGYSKENQVVGIVFETAPEGYAGLIPILVRYGVDQNIKKIYISSPAEGLKETPGCGQRVLEQEFQSQFSNKKLADLKFTDSGGSIQAISGATISSSAVLDGIRQGIERYQHYLETKSVK